MSRYKDVHKQCFGTYVVNKLVAGMPGEAMNPTWALGPQKAAGPLFMIVVVMYVSHV